MEDEAAAAAATMVSLPEDIVREILVRVENMAALFRCAVTCKRWNHLIADASFLRRRWPDDQGACRTPSAFLAGFFTQERRDRRGQILGTFFVPTPRSVFGPGHRSLGSFFPDAAQARLLDRAVPLTARRGLLLVRLTAEDPLAYDYEYELRVCLAMCNPLAGVCDVLPPLSNTFEFNKSGYAILTSADCSSSTQLLPGYPTFFKVLIMGVLEHGRPPHLYTFSSGEARWSTPTVLSFDADPEIRDYRPLRHPDGVVSRGKVHWSAGDWSTNCSKLYTLDVDAETYRVVSRTKLAVPTTNVDVCSRSYDEPQLSVAANGTLSVLFLPWSKLRLEICTRQDNEKAEDGATAGWLDTRLVKLKPPEPEQSETSSMYFSLLGEKSGTVLLKGLHRHMYIGDLGTGAMERMTGWVRGLNRHKLVLFEMDWPTFFVSRLGTRPVPVEACM